MLIVFYLPKSTLNNILKHWRPHTLTALTEELHISNLVNLTHCFLFKQQFPDDLCDTSKILLSECPWFNSSIHVFNSACSRFYALSNLSRIGGMQSEFIWSTLWWRNEDPQKDCVFVTTNLGNQDSTGMQVFDIAPIHVFFLFTDISGIHYSCAIVCWFDKVDNLPNEDTGMWIVQPSYLHDHSSNFAIIHINAIYHAAHLIPIYGTSCISWHIKPHILYDAFYTFYVNKYINHHAFELASWSQSSPHLPIQLLSHDKELDTILKVHYSYSFTRLCADGCPQVDGNTCYWSQGFQMQELPNAIGIAAAVGSMLELPMISPEYSEWHSTHPKDQPPSNHRQSTWVQHQSTLWQDPFITHRTHTGRLRQTSSTSQGHWLHLVQTQWPCLPLCAQDPSHHWTSTYQQGILCLCWRMQVIFNLSQEQLVLPTWSQPCILISIMLMNASIIWLPMVPYHLACKVIVMSAMDALGKIRAHIHLELYAYNWYPHVAQLPHKKLHVQFPSSRPSTTVKCYSRHVTLAFKFSWNYWGIIGRMVNEQKNRAELYQKMVMETIMKAITTWHLAHWWTSWDSPCRWYYLFLLGADYYALN